MTNRLTRLAAVLLAALLLCAAGCGEDAPVPADLTVPTGSDDIVAEPLGTGFTLNHAAAAGFGLGSDKLEDVIARYGEPDKTETQEYTALTITTADYPFGQFVFQAAKGSPPVLTYAGIHSQLAAPMGITFDQQVNEAAEIIYTGSAALIEGMTERQVVFYGDGVHPSTGYYNWLTVEYTSSTTAEKSAAEYIAPGYEEGAIVKYCLYFDADGLMIRYDLQYLTA